MDGNRQQRGNGGLLFFGLVAAAVALAVLSGQTSFRHKPVPVGTPLPEIMATGWIPGDTLPSRQQLAGKVVVIDCWATWCAPCRAAMPDLAKLYAKYEPLGVVFLGLTRESEADRLDIEEFVSKTEGLDWPVGYGASPTLDMLDINIYPTVIVFGSGGSAVWSSHRLKGIEDALDHALAAAEY